MGSGKTQAAITYINEHPYERFIFITPFLDEAARIKDACPHAHFVEPSDKIPTYDLRKSTHTEALIKEGRNISTTHQAFLRYNPDMLTEIQKRGYTLIIDESITITNAFDISVRDMQAVVDAGLVREENDIYSLSDDTYTQGRFADLVGTLRSRPIVRVCETLKDGGKQVYYRWTLPGSLIKSFRKVFVLTYLFEAQDISFLFKYENILYEFIGVKHCDDGKYRFCDYPGDIPEYTRHLKNKIHILDHKKLNAAGDNYYALSKNWFASKTENRELVKRSLQNYFINICKDYSVDKRMWSTLKCVKGKLQGKGYIKSFVPFNERATNKFRNRTCLAYAVNVFMDVPKKNFYRACGIEIDEDAYALSTMVQWIWRSAIRDGKDILIYIPSRRMRELLIKWMDSLAPGGESDE